jgi:hypothetical protein
MLDPDPYLINPDPQPCRQVKFGFRPDTGTGYKKRLDYPLDIRCIPNNYLNFYIVGDPDKQM